VNEGNDSRELILMDEEDVRVTLERLAADLLCRHPRAEGLALVGLRTRGEFLARRLARATEGPAGARVPVGALDITVYRDDFDALQEEIRVRGSQIDFEPRGRHVVLIDDVLFTGRSARAAMDAVIARGRPSTIGLLVLVDRGHRELPIQADLVGRRIETARDDRVRVKLREVDGMDRVVLVRASRAGVDEGGRSAA
jgi:pyrimidine operon attenuation protein/uracil phosphoribosyltransferase